MCNPVTDQWDDPNAPLIPGDTVTCGNRKDLFKKQRRHQWVNLGMDTRHAGDGTFKDYEIEVCDQCGRDRYHKPKQTETTEG